MFRSRLVSSALLRTVAPSLLLACVFGFTPIKVSASANLTGVVYSESNNQRLRHATVLLCDAGGNRIQESITNDSGEFSFLAIPAGSYILKIEATGYDSAQSPVEVNFGTQHGFPVFLKTAGKKSADTPAGSPISAHELSIDESARRRMEAGKKKLYVDKHPAKALPDFEAAVAKAADYYEAYFQIGMTYLALQNSAEAEKNLQKSVDLSQQGFADADLALAALLLGRHDAERGEPLLLRGLELNPNSWTGFFELGRLELHRNHLDAALQAAGKAQALAPQQAMTYRLLSLIHLHQKNDSAALADLEAYIRLDPDSPEGVTAKKIHADLQQRLATSPAAPVAPAATESPH